MGSRSLTRVVTVVFLAVVVLAGGLACASSSEPSGLWGMDQVLRRRTGSRRRMTSGLPCCRDSAVSLRLAAPTTPPHGRMGTCHLNRGSETQGRHDPGMRAGPSSHQTRTNMPRRTAGSHRRGRAQTLANAVMPICVAAFPCARFWLRNYLTFALSISAAPRNTAARLLYGLLCAGSPR
jgi:hypothetical protein